MRLSWILSQALYIHYYGHRVKFDTPLRDTNEFLTFDCTQRHIILLLQVDYKSTNMEVQGLKRALRFLKEKINISEVVTATTVISCLGIVYTCMCVKQHF